MIDIENNQLINWGSIFYKAGPPNEVGTYTLRHKEENGFYLERVEDLVAPAKIYGDVSTLVDRFIVTFEDRQALHKNTGIMLSGIKGSGKTLSGILLSQRLLKKGVITVLINRPVTGDKFNAFMASITQPALFLFDEFEKNFTNRDQQRLLTLFSGVIQGSKLFCLMVNDRNRIEDNFNDRPDRIYYNLHFPDLSNKALEEYLKDALHDYKESVLKDFRDLRQTGTLLSFDMVRALVEEMNRFSTDVFDAAKYIVTPQVAKSDQFKLTATKEGYAPYTAKFNSSIEMIKSGVSISTITGRSDRYLPYAPKPAEKSEEEKANEAKAKEFEKLVVATELNRDDLVESNDVMKNFVFVKDDIKFEFSIDNANQAHSSSPGRVFY